MKIITITISECKILGTALPTFLTQMSMEYPEFTFKEIKGWVFNDYIIRGPEDIVQFVVDKINEYNKQFDKLSTPTPKPVKYVVKKQSKNFIVRFFRYLFPLAYKTKAEADKHLNPNTIINCYDENNNLYATYGCVKID